MKRMMMCNQPWCRCRTRHERAWVSNIHLGARIHAFLCGNCGEPKIGRHLLIAFPDQDLRFATPEEVRRAKGK